MSVAAIRQLVRIADSLERQTMLQEYVHLKSRDLDSRADSRLWGRRQKLYKTLWPKEEKMADLDTEVTLTIRFRLKGTGDKRGALREIKAAIANTLREDFGREAWGGYDGPRVSNVEVIAAPQEGK